MVEFMRASKYTGSEPQVFESETEYDSDSEYGHDTVSEYGSDCNLYGGLRSRGTADHESSRTNAVSESPVFKSVAMCESDTEHEFDTHSEHGHECVEYMSLQGQCENERETTKSHIKDWTPAGCCGDCDFRSYLARNGIRVTGCFSKGQPLSPANFKVTGYGSFVWDSKPLFIYSKNSDFNAPRGGGWEVTLSDINNMRGRIRVTPQFLSIESIQCHTHHSRNGLYICGLSTSDCHHQTPHEDLCLIPNGTSHQSGSTPISNPYFS